MELTAFGQTDVGQVRPHNEDSILLEPSLQLYAVADGMGGHKGGEFASRICLDTLRDYLQMAARGHAPLVGETDAAHSEAANLLGSAVRFANRAVFEASFSKPEWRGMGTTIVALTVADNRGGDRPCRGQPGLSPASGDIQTADRGSLLDRRTGAGRLDEP